MRSCEACGFDFGKTYGDRGQGFIECHHVEPLHQTGERATSIRDLALLGRHQPSYATSFTGSPLSIPGGGSSRRSLRRSLSISSGRLMLSATWKARHVRQAGS